MAYLVTKKEYEHWPCERFIFYSDARRFQRKMQRKGYKTRRIVFAGSPHPYALVYYKQKLTFHGIDSSNKISLLEYGLLVSDQQHEDGSGTYFCVYRVSHPDGGSWFDCGHISEKQVNGYIEGTEFPSDADIESFLSFNDMSKAQWLGLNFTHKLWDLLQYWGYENIMGTAYHPMPESEAVSLYLK